MAFPVLLLVLLGLVFALSRARGWPFDLAASVTAWMTVLLGLVVRRLGWTPAGRERRRLAGLRLSDLDRFDGHAFEAWVAARLEGGGFSVAATGATRDFGVDLIAESGPVRIGIEAKRYDGKVGNRHVRSLVAGCRYHACGVGVLVTQSRFTRAAERQAGRAGIPILLIGRDELPRLLECVREAIRG